MKKLVLKKDVVARINQGEMNRLRGGEFGYSDWCTWGICQTAVATCMTEHTCTGEIDPTCVASETGSCEVTCDNLCDPSCVVSQCDTCYVRCTY